MARIQKEISFSRKEDTNEFHNAFKEFEYCSIIKDLSFSRGCSFCNIIINSLDDEEKFNHKLEEFCEENDFSLEPLNEDQIPQ